MKIKKQFKKKGRKFQQLQDYTRLKQRQQIVDICKKREQDIREFASLPRIRKQLREVRNESHQSLEMGFRLQSMKNLKADKQKMKQKQAQDYFFKQLCVGFAATCFLQQFQQKLLRLARKYYLKFKSELSGLPEDGICLRYQVLLTMFKQAGVFNQEFNQNQLHWVYKKFVLISLDTSKGIDAERLGFFLLRVARFLLQKRGQILSQRSLLSQTKELLGYFFAKGSLRLKPEAKSPDNLSPRSVPFTQEYRSTRVQESKRSRADRKQQSTERYLKKQL